MKKQNSEFNSALSDFTGEFAYRGAIRHLAGLGYSVRKIQENLTYPVPIEVVSREVWKYYTEMGRILVEDPDNWNGPEKVSYVRTVGPYGRSSFIKKTEKLPKPQDKYYRCDFGLLKYKDPERYERILDLLITEDREYISNLPWPRQTVWHVMDERMIRIAAAIDR